jgi:hypothetical protein
MGLVRDRIFARTYGAGPELDAYNAALVIPELTLAVLVIAGLALAFVPVFSRTDRSDPEQPDFARTTLTTAVLLRPSPTRSCSSSRRSRSGSWHRGSTRRSRPSTRRSSG